MQQSDDSPELDAVMMTIGRVSAMEYEAIGSTLRQLPCVKEFREDGARG